MSSLHPFPAGWYAVATSLELKPGSLHSRRMFGAPWAVYRTRSGRAGVLHATCPHMGADLGRGDLCGEHVRCAFHHFAFAPDGRCASTPYDGPAPAAARATVLPVVERNGLVMAWWHPEGDAPSWQVPELPADGFTPMAWRSLTLQAHVQDIAENSVDIGHFRAVHGFDEVHVLAPMTIDGPCLTVNYAFEHKLSALSWRTTFTAQVWGLGYSLVQVHMPATDVRLRMWILPMPTDDGHVTLRMATSGPTRNRGLIPGAVLGRIVRAFSVHLLRHDVLQDREIWAHRTHVHRPALARGDGPVGPYRAWARQFYPTASAAIQARA